LAVGQCWLGLGSDLGGSLRTPASFCGVVGLRPSPGIVPRTGSPKDCPGVFGLHSVNGPLARTVRDTALLLDSIRGHQGWSHAYTESLDFLASREFSFSDQLSTDIRGYRIAYIDTFDIPRKTKTMPPSPTTPPSTICTSADEGATEEVGNSLSGGSQRAFQRDVNSKLADAVHALRAHGATVMGRPEIVETGLFPDLQSSELDYSHFRNATPIFLALRGEAFASAFGDKREWCKPEVQWNVDLGIYLASHPELLLEAHQLLERLRSWSEELFTRFDLIIAPCTQVPPFDARIRYLSQAGERSFRNYVEWFSPTYSLSLLNIPVLSIPCGLDSNGLPIGIQVAGRNLDDLKVLNAGAAIENFLQNHFSPHNTVDAPAPWPKAEENRDRHPLRSPGCFPYKPGVPLTTPKLQSFGSCSVSGFTTDLSEEEMTDNNSSKKYLSSCEGEGAGWVHLEGPRTAEEAAAHHARVTFERQLTFL